MKIQGVNFLGFRPIREVNKHGNNGESTIEEVNTLYKRSNYSYSDNNIILSEPIFEECRIPRAAVVDLLDNYDLSKETRRVLEKYSKMNSEEVVLNVKDEKKRSNWYLHLSILDTVKFGVIVALLVAILITAITL